MSETGDDRPANIRWLPPGLRPPGGMTGRQESVFLLVGAAMLFARLRHEHLRPGHAANPGEPAYSRRPAVDHAVGHFRLGHASRRCCWRASADLVGRRRLLLVTIFGQAMFTLVTAFAQDYTQFVWLQVATRVFGYAEEMLCFVVIAEEVAAAARGWANGTLAAMNYVGAGIASLVFAAITLLPYRLAQRCM